MGKIFNWFAVEAGASTLVSVQWLRFLAALLVVLSHAGLSAQEGAGDLGQTLAVIPFSGNFGVCVFFVISGFIMLHISGGKFGRSRAPLTFARNRIIRIVPMYWAITTAQLAIMVAGSQTGTSRGLPDWLDVSRSYLFIPYLDEAAKHRPILGVGWTLNFEMFFYALFCLALFLPRRVGLPALIAVMCVFALWPWDTGSMAIDILSHPIILYFVAGMVLAVVRQGMIARHPLPHVPMAPALCTLGFIAFTTINIFWPNPIWSPLWAVGLVALAVLTEDAQGSRVMRDGASMLGAASYSLYLSHPLVLSMGLLVWLRVLPNMPGEVFYALAIAVSLIGGLLCWRLVERPLTELVRH